MAKKGSIILLLYGPLGKRIAISTHTRTSGRPLLPRSDHREGAKDIQRVADRMLALRGVELEKLVLTSSAKDLESSSTGTRLIHFARTWTGLVIELKRQKIDPPIQDTVRIPTARSTVPQSKSLYKPLGPDPGAQYGNVVATLQLGSKVSVVWPV
jgi:hypothetical protein